MRYAIIRLTMKFHNNKIVTITILPGVSRKCISCLIWSLDSFSIHSLAALAKGQLISKQVLKFSFEPKKEQKYFCISALAYKTKSNQKSSVRE